MRWLVLAAMIAGGMILGPLLLLLWAAVLFSALTAGSLLSLAGSLARLVRRP